MPKKTYKVGKEIYDIEESQSADFLKDVPSAIEVKSFLVGKDTFDIAVNEVNNFLRDVPSAKPLFEEPLKKKEPTYPGLKDAFGMSLRGPLMEKSNLQVTTKKEKQPLKSDLKAEELKSIETNLAKENIELSQIKQKLTALEKSGKLQDPTIQAEYNGLVGQYNEKQKAAKGQFDKYHKEHGNYRTIIRDEQNADLKKGINTAKGVLNKINTYDATLKQVGLRYGQTKVALEEAMQAGDNDAAAQLQGQLKKDEAIIANLGELIKTGKKVAAGQEQDSFGNNINIGIYQAFGTILQSPQGLTKAALTPIMEYGMGLDPVQRELMFRTLAQLNPNMMASETLAEFGGEISTKAEGRKQMANMNRLYGGSSYNALMKGDILNAVSYAAKDFANSLPSSTLYATGAGAALMSAGMVGDEIRRTEEETGQAIGSKEILTASVKAGLEVVTERMFGDGKAAVELVKRLGKAGAEKAISDAVKEIARKGLGRKIAEQAGEEVVGESLNQIGANAADIYINGKKDINLWDGVGDAALIALVGGGAYGGALTTASHYIDKARIKEAEDLKSQAANYMEQSMMQQNPAAAEVLEEKANTLNLEAQNIVDREQEIALNANPETVDAIIALEGLKEQLEEALQEEGLPEEVAVVLEEKLSALQVEHNELIVQATKEAQENIKAEEEEVSEPIDVTEFLKGDTKEEDLTRPSIEVVEAPNETPKAGSVGVGGEVKEPKSYAEATDAYKATELGGSEDAKNKKQALVEQAETEEGKKFVESEVSKLEKNDDGTITVFRSGTLQEGHNPATTSRKMAETIASERKKQGLSSDIIEVRVNPSDISVVVKGIESEVFVKVDKTNKERLDKNTVQKQKTKSELLAEKDEVQKELDKTKKALDDSERAFNDGTYPFSENVFKDANKKQKAKIKNLEWQLSKIEQSLKETPQAEAKEEVKVEETPALKDVESTTKALSNVDSKILTDKIKEIAIEVNFNLPSLIKSIPTKNKNKFGNSINEFEATNPFTKEKKIFKKQTDAVIYLNNEIAKADTTKGRINIISEAYHKAKQNDSNPELVKAVEELLTNKKETPASESKVGENKYEYDPKAKDSSRDIGSRADDSRAKESDITAGTNKGESSENVSVPTKEEVVQEEPTKEEVKSISVEENLNNIRKEYGDTAYKLSKQQIEKLGEEFTDLNRVKENADRIIELGEKDKGLAVSEALFYEQGYPDNWQDLRNAIKKGGIDVNFDSVKRMIEVGIKLPNDIIEEFKKSDKYKDANPELVKAVEQSLKETPKAEVKEDVKVQETPALKDVESTAKALNKVDTESIKNKLGIAANWDMLGEGDLFDSKSPEARYTQRLLSGWHRANQKGEINPNSKITYDIVRGRFGSEDQKDVVEAKDENGITIGVVKLNNKSGIEHIAVAPEFRGKGVADKLIQTLRENNPNLDLSKTELRSKGFEKAFGNKIISEAYHKAKKDRSNPELVKAVEELLTNKKETPASESKAGAKSPFDLVAEEENAYKQKQEETKQEAKKDIELINSDDEATIEKYFKKSRYKEMPDGKGYYFSTGSSRIIKKTKKQVALDTAENIVNKKTLGLPQSRVEEIVREFETNKQKQNESTNEKTDEGSRIQEDGEKGNEVVPEGVQDARKEGREDVNKQDQKELLKSKPKEVKSKLTPDQAVSNLEGLKVEVKEKAPEPKVKPKKKRLPSRKAINKLDPTTPSDFIALALANIHISLKSFYDANDRNNIKVEEGKFPYVRLNYLRKNGYSLDKLVTDLANDKVAFPFEMSEDDIRKRIIGFMFDNLNGPNSYAVKMLNVPDAEQEYYDRKQAEFEQMLSEEKEAREAELDAIDTAWSQLENDIETLSEEDIDKILSLMVEEDNENINNIIESNNEKQDIGGEKDGGIVVSENTGSQKDNQGKSREELEEKVKEKKSAVDKAQNALSKAKANLEKAVSESQRDIFGKAEAENKLFAPDLKALNKVISDKESILALAKESLQKANDELKSWTPKNQTKISFDNTKKQKVAAAERTIDNAAEWLKQKLKIELPDGTKKSGGAFTDEQIIDLIANAAKALAKGAIVSIENIKEVINSLKEGGFLEGFDEADIETKSFERTQTKENNEKDNTEESLLEEPQNDRDEAKTGQDGPELRTDSKEKGERKIRRHFLTILNNASLKEATKFMLENDFAYNVKSMERSLSRAKAYLEKNGMEDSYNNFITYGTQIEGLTGDESIALAFLMQTIINEAVIKEVESGNQNMADELYDEFYRLSEKLSVIGTESGRVVNAFNLFLLDMSNPISAQMALNRIAKKAENKAKASDSKERKKAESKTKAVKSEVDKGKRKASREVAEFAEDITKEDSELGDIIFKGSKKPISDEMKAKISDFFDNFIPDDEGMLYDGVLGVPLLAWKGFVIGVKKLVIEGSIPLVNAIKQQYDAMVGEYGKETMDKVSAEFQKRSGTTPKEITKKVVEAREAKSKKLNAEKFNLEKELQKERDRVAKLRAKEKESQQARIDEQSAKLKLQEAKEAQKAVEDKIEKDRVEKQKTLTQAKKEALKNELAAAKQKAKDAQKVLDLADKMALKTIQAELKEAQNKEKQLEKDIDKLGKELVRNRLFEDLVADLVDEYINMKGDTKNEDLIKLVEERLGVKGEKAVKIANKIRSSVYNNVTKRVSDRFERDIETEKKRLYGPEIVEAYEKMTGDEATKDKELLKLIEEKLKLTGEKANQVAKKVKEGTYGKKEPKSGEQIVDELVFAINSKMMTADMMMDLFPSKYGMVNFTAEDFQKVRELSQAIATAPSSERKAIAIKNFLEYLYSFKPYYFAELMNELWYFDVLSGVLTIGLQTGDVNNFYNFVQASAMAKEVPIVSALQSVRRAFEDKKIDYGVSALKDVLTGFKKGLIQTMVRPTANEVKTASAWIKFAFKNKAFLNESRSAFVESFLNGTASFTDFDNPFKNSALGEFDIRRVWDGARKNKSEGKKGLAYLYWLAMENVYNVGAAAYRFITPFVNKIVPQVGKTLAAQDLFFTGIIKNTYSPFVLREQLRKEGLRGAELEAELAKRLYITEEELASARYTATNWRMKYDIGFSQNEKGEWNIYDNGKVVKKFSLGRFKTMNFATLEEAEDYARTVVAPSGSRYRLDVISQLNLKRGMEALKAEKRIASFNLLTKASMGYTGTLLSALNSASNWLTKQSETISESASLKDSRAMRYGLNILATSVLYATHLFSFLKVGTGLARMFSQYYTPIGLARAVRADLQNKSLLGKELDENISKTEVDMLYAKALLGLIPTYFAAGMAQRLAELIKDDEDKDEEKKEVELTAQEKKFLELIEKKNGIKLTNEQKKVLTLVKPGDVVGNLQWMEAGMRRFYTNNKILVESSEFKGYDEQGNRMWSSLSAYPNYILAESIATAAWYMYFNKDNKESNPVTQFVLNPLYKFIDLSIGQGIVKYFASKTSTENKLEALAQTIVFDQLGVFNPNLLSGVMKYVDGKARKNENIFDYIDNQEDGSYPTAIGAYTLDKVVPLKGAWYEATQAPIVYGQFGEEIFRVPAEKQGYISAAIGYYKNKDKNPEQKAMNEFFLSIGINKLYVPDKSPIIDENFKPHKLTPRQRDEYGMLAGRVSFSQFKKLTPLIQEVYSKVSEKAAGDMVNKVFVSNYKNMAAFKLGLITQKEFDRLSTENIASVIVKAVKSMNQSVLSEDVLEALEVTKEEKDFMENMKKVSGEDNKRAIFLKQMNQLKDETEMSDYLVRMYQLKIMSENMFNELYNYKYLNGTIGANIPERIEEEENQEEEEN